jgi:uncharacterized protein
MSEPFRVLTLDGGGILGYYEASLLHEISKLSNTKFIGGKNADIGASFDILCGTSTGSIIAAGLAKGISIEEIKSLYKNNAKQIFPHPKPTSKSGELRWALFNSSFWPSSSEIALKKVLTDTLKDMTFEEVWKNREVALCIPTVNVRTHKPSVLKTPHLSRLSRDNKMKLVDACLSSAAAPIYFPIAEIDDPMNTSAESAKLYHADGGLWANNPVLIGLTEALEMAETDQPIEIYSIGTPVLSEASESFLKDTHKGLIGWMFGVEIVKMSLFAQSIGHNYIANLLAKSLTNSGRSVKIYRIPDSTPSKEQLASLDLDRNDSAAFEVMQTLAKSVSQDLKSAAARNDELSSKFIDLFHGMKTI